MEGGKLLRGSTSLPTITYEFSDDSISLPAGLISSGTPEGAPESYFEPLSSSAHSPPEKPPIHHKE